MAYFDPLYLVFALPALALSFVASLLLNYWYGKYSGIRNKTNLSGSAAAKQIAAAKGLQVNLVESAEKLSDNYNPSTRELTLSADVSRSNTIASVAIAMHELGHVQQHQSGSLLMTIRNWLVPTVNIGSNLGYILLIIGLAIGITGLAWLGIALFSLATIFTLLTLPIELDASRRGLEFIKQYELLTTDELPGARKVLLAAALTYVAAVVASLGNLLYFILQVRASDRD